VGVGILGSDRRRTAKSKKLTAKDAKDAKSAKEEMQMR
jgi:hypothetical protein